MNLIEKIKTNWLACIIIIGISCISSTWFAANEILVKPRDFALNERDKKITEKEREISNLKIAIKKFTTSNDYREEKKNIKQLNNENKEIKNKLTNYEKESKSILMQLENCKKERANLSKNFSEKQLHLIEINDESKKQGSYEVKVDDISFMLNICSLAGNIIKCNLSIVNNRINDTELAITHGTLFDQDGIKYNAMRVIIGGHETGWMHEQDLISEVKTAAEIAFDVSKGNIDKITALKFYAHGAFGKNVSNWGNKGSGARLISFKNIKINK